MHTIPCASLLSACAPCYHYHVCLIVITTCALSLLPCAPYYCCGMHLIMVTACAWLSLSLSCAPHRCHHMHLGIITMHSPCCHCCTFTSSLSPHVCLIVIIVTTFTLVSSPCVHLSVITACTLVLSLCVCLSIVTAHLPRHCHHAFASALLPYIHLGIIATHSP